MQDLFLLKITSLPLIIKVGNMPQWCNIIINLFLDVFELSKNLDGLGNYTLIYSWMSFHKFIFRLPGSCWQIQNTEAVLTSKT